MVHFPHHSLVGSFELDSTAGDNVIALCPMFDSIGKEFRSIPDRSNIDRPKMGLTAYVINGDPYAKQAFLDIGEPETLWLTQKQVIECFRKHPEIFPQHVDVFFLVKIEDEFRIVQVCKSIRRGRDRSLQNYSSIYVAPFSDNWDIYGGGALRNSQIIIPKQAN
jgi:hypothetical protein